MYQKLNYWVYENFLRAKHGDVDCRKTVTLAISAEYPELWGLLPIIQRWHAPISVALYCAREDYKNCLDTMYFIRACLPVDSQRYFLSKFVTFHIFFEDDKLPEEVFRGFNNTHLDCSEDPMQRKRHHSTTNDIYRHNVGRNIAKQAALTHYVLSGDIDMVPSISLPSDFMEMIALSRSLHHPEGTVFMLPIFEVNEYLDMPRKKTDLLEMIENEQANEWNAKPCEKCHKILDVEEWKKSSNKTGKRSSIKSGEFNCKKYILF